jgi:hypothetical protein
MVPNQTRQATSYFDISPLLFGQVLELVHKNSLSHLASVTGHDEN